MPLDVAVEWGGAAGEHMMAIVAGVFPGLAAGSVRIDRTGGDHVLLIVDERYAFRFPRRHRLDLTLEIEVLKRLRRRSILATPSYDYVDPQGRFAGYPFIAGVPLTPARFAALAPDSRDAMIDEAARFLSELHAIRPASIADAPSWPRAWTAAQFAGRALSERLPALAARMPPIADALESLYTRYREDRPETPVVIHGDFVGDHILLDERSGRLSGIIDFGDVALGAAAQDFLGFWAYGSAVARAAAGRYKSAVHDAGLLRRSLHHFIRYRLDCLYEISRDGQHIDWSRAAAEIAALLRIAGI